MIEEVSTTATQVPDLSTAGSETHELLASYSPAKTGIGMSTAKMLRLNRDSSTKDGSLCVEIDAIGFCQESSHAAMFGKQAWTMAASFLADTPQTY